MATAFTSLFYARKFSLEDAGKVEKASKHVLFIDQNGKVVDRLTNNNYALDVIAVIGPSLYHGEAVNKAVLLEIGFRRSRPYAPNRTFKKRRRQYCKITEQQINNCWNVIEEIICKEVDGRTSVWNSTLRWIYYGKIKADKISAKASKKKEVKHFRQRGIYLSVNADDKVALSVFLKSELLKRQICLRKDMKEVADIAAVLLNNAKVSQDSFVKRSLKNDKSPISIFVGLLDKRNLRPHQLYFLLKSCKASIRQNLMSLLIYLKYDLQRINDFGKMTEDFDVPVFEQDVYLYTRPIRNRRYVTIEISRPAENHEPKSLSFDSKSSTEDSIPF